MALDAGGVYGAQDLLYRRPPRKFAGFHPQLAENRRPLSQMASLEPLLEQLGSAPAPMPAALSGGIAGLLGSGQGSPLAGGGGFSAGISDMLGGPTPNPMAGMAAPTPQFQNVSGQPSKPAIEWAVQNAIRRALGGGPSPRPVPSGY